MSRVCPLERGLPTVKVLLVTSLVSLPETNRNDSLWEPKVPPAKLAPKNNGLIRVIY